MNEGVSIGSAIRYGLPGFALAFAALPLYLLTPVLYADTLGLSLAAVGVVLMITRLVDAIADPWIGRRIDRSQKGYWPWVAGGLAVLAASLGLLVNPPVSWFDETQHASSVALLWMGVCALIVSLSNSVAMLAHQGWAVAWTAEPSNQSRLVAGRETWALFGVILAAALAAQREGPLMAIVLVTAVVIAFFATAGLGHHGRRSPKAPLMPSRWRDILGSGPFTRLLGIFGLNAMASAIPATLVLFFIQDLLRLSAGTAGAMLALYFISAAISIPFWSRLARQSGRARTWRYAMFFAVAAFVWALLLKEGQWISFALICIMTGSALGAELLIPPLLLGQAIASAGHRQQHEASYFGVWNLTAKLALAASAGLALPLLAWMNYVPGRAAAEDSVLALQWAYAGLPCALKLVAIALLLRFEKHYPHFQQG